MKIKVALFLMMMLTSETLHAEGLSSFEIRSIRRELVEVPSSCKDGKGSCEEELVLKRYPHMAQRQGSRLLLKLAHGEKEFADFQGKSEGDVLRYRLMAFLEALDGFVLYKSGYEDTQAFFIDRKSGNSLALLGFPMSQTSLKFNDDGDRMLDYSYGNPYGPNSLRVYSYGKTTGFALIHEGFSPCFDHKHLDMEEDKSNIHIHDVNFHWDEGKTLRVAREISYHSICRLN